MHVTKESPWTCLKQMFSTQLEHRQGESLSDKCCPGEVVELAVCGYQTVRKNGIDVVCIVHTSQ